MRFLRSVDNLSHALASSQARIFENSVSFGIPSKTFIRSYMLSKESKLIDELVVDVAGLSENELFDEIGKKIKTKRGELYSYSIMHYIGYFYRMASYLTGYGSSQLYQSIKPSLLHKNYRTLHALPIEEAIKEVFGFAEINIEDKYSLFKKIYKLNTK